MKDHADETEVIVEADTVGDVAEDEEPVTEEAIEVDNDATEETTEDAVAEDEEPEADEIVVSFGDEESDAKPEAESSVLRESRKRERGLLKRVKELERAAKAKLEADPIELGPKPDIADFDFDVSKYDAARDAYNDRKSAIARREQTEKEAQDAIRKEFDDKFTSYKAASVSLGYDDFDESQAVVTDILSVQQQSVLIDVATDSAKLVYALGKYPDKAEELAKITNPVRLAAAIARMENKMTVSGKRSKPAPEKRMKPGGPVPVSGEKKLEQLRKAAEISRDYTEVRAYKQKLRSK